jgi:alkanesulfonate monooxygenase SsuD/methylene tetrahydromethanopterin reductase-like flavin-dependent oxidoreductase (luciferase family)
MVAIIGGETHRFRPLVDLYREAGRRAGHAPEKLTVGMHSLGYVADTRKEAAEDFYPGFARVMTEIGKERGWAPMTRPQFDANLTPKGAWLLGEPEEVAEKILRHSEALGGITRVTFQMNAASVPHAKLMHATELLGAKIAPILHKELSPTAA